MIIKETHFSLTSSLVYRWLNKMPTWMKNWRRIEQAQTWRRGEKIEEALSDSFLYWFAISFFVAASRFHLKSFHLSDGNLRWLCFLLASSAIQTDGAIVRSIGAIVPLSVSRARSMAVLVKKFARRDGSEQSGSVEQEASINGSQELRHEMVTGRGIEAIVNSLVSKRNLLDARNLFDEMPLF